MSDPNWQDPFADDDGARERERRRAERETRRRSRSEKARESLARRVRDGDSNPPREREPRQRPRLPRPPKRRARSGSEPPRWRTNMDARRGRAGALIGLGALIALVAGAGAVVSRQGDDEPAAKPAAERPTISITIPEGYDRSQIAPLAKKAGLEGSYTKATRRAQAINLKRYGAKGADSLEGFLFPATYEVFEGAGVNALVRRQLAAFAENIAGIDLSYAKSRNLSAYDVVIIASMIEREISIPEERKLAASVIYNRLQAGNPLGIDATIRFEDENYDEPLLESRLNADTPYNTRLDPGLPPGPIGNPGLASLEAAARPARTDHFYYVVKPGTCGEHEFVETEAEFNAAQARYNTAREAAGGKSPTEC